ncbi:hypothetical protein [Hymenobacter sp. IS2118]|uniref:hypothetical protein n=1 Tax=Hymenobacter sp. IS2118 TaxID=1505605 RepID=UPI00055040E2|nr:hypothetical protein [Hymenobacter sp. IS2118]
MSTSDSYTQQRDADIALSTELHKSSAQEFDKQLVYLAGGGLALTLTFAKDIAAITGSRFVPLLFFTWLAFALALLFNLFSHRKATATHDYARSLHLYLRECHTTSTAVDPARSGPIQASLAAANRWLHRLNSAAEVSVTVGIFAFIVFVALNVTASMSSSAKPTSPPSAPAAPVSPPGEIRGVPAPSTVVAPPPPPVPASPPPATTSQAR